MLSKLEHPVENIKHATGVQLHLLIMFASGIYILFCFLFSASKMWNWLKCVVRRHRIAGQRVRCQIWGTNPKSVTGRRGRGLTHLSALEGKEYIKTTAQRISVSAEWRAASVNCHLWDVPIFLCPAYLCKPQWGRRLIPANVTSFSLLEITWLMCFLHVVGATWG